MWRMAKKKHEKAVENGIGEFCKFCTPEEAKSGKAAWRECRTCGTFCCADCINIKEDCPNCVRARG